MCNHYYTTWPTHSRSNNNKNKKWKWKKIGNESNTIIRRKKHVFLCLFRFVVDFAFFFLVMLWPIWMTVEISHVGTSRVTLIWRVWMYVRYFVVFYSLSLLFLYLSISLFLFINFSLLFLFLYLCSFLFIPPVSPNFFSKSLDIFHYDKRTVATISIIYPITSCNNNNNNTHSLAILQLQLISIKCQWNT